ncbi:MAG: 50S ribosomal protein L16 [Candidatus Woesearchaeota archaeon]
MAKMIRAVAWRRLERPYTRKSKYRNKDFVRGVPTNKIIKYVMGTQNKEYEYRVVLRAKSDVQIRHNAIEAARKTTNKHLDRKAPQNYMFKIKVYPHHILRNNPLAAGAGADRMSTGMSHSFGKPVGIAARIKKGQEILEVFVNKNRLKVAKESLHRARMKFPIDCFVEVEQIKSN